MGWLDFFRSDSPRALKKHTERVANRRAQNPDRWESIQALAKVPSAETSAALMQRFGFRVDPSIVDQEEKELVVQTLAQVGDIAIEPVRAYLNQCESIGWPIKVLSQLVDEVEVHAAVLSLLDAMDTEYERDPQKKIQVIAYFEEHRATGVLESVTPFLNDMNETVRFHAVGALLAQGADAAPALLARVPKEDSVRVQTRILDAAAENQWPLAPDLRDHIKQGPLNDRYSLTKNSSLAKK